MTINKPYTFTSGTLAVAPEVNSNFNVIYNAYNAVVIQGSGSPEGVVTSTIGVLYQDTNTSGTGKLYRKSTNSGNTGWLEITGTGGGGSGGGSATILTIDEMYKEFYIS